MPTSIKQQVSLVARMPAMQETPVQSLGQEDPPKEGGGNPLQYCCLENSMDRGAWRTTVLGVTESDTTDQLTFSLFALSIK